MRDGADRPMLRALRRLQQAPHLLVPGLLAWLRGWVYRLRFLLTGRHFSAGRFFRVYGNLYISGPGKVVLGDDCLIIADAIKPVCIRTLTRQAHVTLADHVGLNGTSIQCAESVEIGPWSNIADAYITDTPAHSIGRGRRGESIDAIRSNPVVIGNNVWVSVQVVILHGVRIGSNSVVGACSLVRKDVAANVFVAGNPLRVIRSIEA